MNTLILLFVLIASHLSGLNGLPLALSSSQDNNDREVMSLIQEIKERLNVIEEKLLQSNIMENNEAAGMQPLIQEDPLVTDQQDGPIVADEWKPSNQEKEQFTDPWNAPLNYDTVHEQSQYNPNSLNNEESLRMQNELEADYIPLENSWNDKDDDLFMNSKMQNQWEEKHRGNPGSYMESWRDTNNRNEEQWPLVDHPSDKQSMKMQEEGQPPPSRKMPSESWNRDSGQQWKVDQQWPPAVDHPSDKQLMKMQEEGQPPSRRMPDSWNRDSDRQWNVDFQGEFKNDRLPSGIPG